MHVLICVFEAAGAVGLLFLAPRCLQGPHNNRHLHIPVRSEHRPSVLHYKDSSTLQGSYAFNLSP